MTGTVGSPFSVGWVDHGRRWSRSRHRSPRATRAVGDERHHRARPRLLLLARRRADDRARRVRPRASPRLSTAPSAELLQYFTAPKPLRRSQHGWGPVSVEAVPRQRRHGVVAVPRQSHAVVTDLGLSRPFLVTAFTRGFGAPSLRPERSSEPRLRPHKRRRDVRFRASRRSPFEAVQRLLLIQLPLTGCTRAMTVSTPRSALYFVE